MMQESPQHAIVNAQQRHCQRCVSIVWSHRAAFTLTELMVAVLVLIVVVIGTSKIFGTASRVTGVGQATASMMTEAATIERQMREDIARLTTEGFFAIRCVAVRNNIHDPVNNQILLNPNLPPTAIIRADQLVFFANGVSTMSTFRASEGISSRAQNLASRVYYGHAFQLRNGQPATAEGFSANGNPNYFHTHDPVPSIYGRGSITAAFPAPTPWHRTTSGLTNIPMVRNRFGSFNGLGTSMAGLDMYSPTGAVQPIDGTQPEARQWLLARQAVVLIDDDPASTVGTWQNNARTRWAEDPTSGLESHPTARSIFIHNAASLPWGWSREIRNGRLDAAATQLEDIRQWVTHWPINHQPDINQRRPWSDPAIATGDQRFIIEGAVYYPRAERRAPGPYRVDQALTNHVIGSACSSFIIDWTYDDGVGAVFDGAGNIEVAPGPDLAFGTPDDYDLLGVGISPGAEHPWFGLDEDYPGSPNPPWPMGPGVRGVRAYGSLPPSGTPGALYTAATTIMPVNSFPNNIESQIVNTPDLKDYWAIFGYNSDHPIDPSTGNPWPTTPALDNGAYTPFPSAIRVTMTLHDPEGRLEGGREFQFVIRLPKRNQ